MPVCSPTIALQAARVAETGGQWPPKGIVAFDPWHLPLFNTLILLTSGTTVTWAHHALLHNDRKGLKWGLALTVLLGMLFTGVQAYEYGHAAFAFSRDHGGNIYGSTFFMATGFHGFHVIVGTIFLIVCFFRALAGHFRPEQHFGFEAAAWYWHFVDVIWLFLFSSIYVWAVSFGYRRRIGHGEPHDSGGTGGGSRRGDVAGSRRLAARAPRSQASALRAELSDALDGTSAPLSLAGAEAAIARQARDHVPVRTRGVFAHGEERYLFATRNGEPGWRVITPLITNLGGRLVLVDRGFVPSSLRIPSARPGGQPWGSVTVQGLLRPLRAKGMFTPSNEPFGNIWYWPDIPALLASLGPRRAARPRPTCSLPFLTKPSPATSGPAPSRPASL